MEKMLGVVGALLIGVLYFLWRATELLERISKQLRNYHIQADERHQADRANFWAGIERVEKASRRTV
jgi:hypothetical protein